MDLICPKCQGTMRAYERNGVTVDQCSDCRGIFLDRGELEHLINAESSWYSTTPAPAQVPRPEQPRYDERGQGGYDYKRRKKRSFLEDLFD